MRKTPVALNAALGAVLLFGCASPPAIPGMEIKPTVSLQHGGDQAAGYYELGRYYQGQNRPDLAADAYGKALALDAAHVEAHNGLGVIHAAQQNFDAARIEFETAIALTPRAAHLYNNLGYTLYLQGNPSAAIAVFEKAAALDPTNSRTWNNLGLARAQVGQKTLARDAFARASDVMAAPPPASSEDRGTTSPGAAVATPAPAELAVPKDRGIIRVAPQAATPAAERAESPDPAIMPQPSAVTASQAGIEVVTAPPAAPALPMQSREPAAEPGDAPRLVTIAPNVYELKWAPVALAPPVAFAQTPAPIAAQGFGLEVANGNGITGMARRVGQILAASGAPAARLTNQKPYAQAVTEVQYREGYAVPATALHARIPGTPALVASKSLRPGTDVRLVLGRDLPHDVALVEPTIDSALYAVTPARAPLASN